MESVAVTARREDLRDRWVRIALALRDRKDGTGRAGTYGVCAYTPSFRQAIEGADDLAAGYSLDNWESGIISSVRWVSRKSGRDLVGVLISELTGLLASPDMSGLVKATETAVALLLGCEPSESPSTAGWQVTVQRPGDVPHTSTPAPVT